MPVEMSQTWIIYCFIFAVLTQTDQAVKLKPMGACDMQAVDIVFVIESSSSIWRPDFDRQLKFILDVCDQFDVGLGATQTRVGVVTFADSYYVQFHLWQNSRKDLLPIAVSRIRHKAGQKTYLGSALNYVLKTMFTRQYGARASAIHVAIVITDGGSQDRKETLVAAKAARDSGIHVFAIGVGSDVEYDELEEIASEPSSQYVFTVNNFISLDTTKMILVNRTCQGTTIRPGAPAPLQQSPALNPPRRIHQKQTTALNVQPLSHLPAHTTTTDAREKELFRPTPNTIPLLPSGSGLEIQGDNDPNLNVTNCGGKPADIYFAIDSSNSIWPEDFKKQLTFVRDLISLFDISQKKTRVGLVTFSDSVKPIFDFNSKQEKSELLKQISNIEFMSGRTNTGAALRFIHEQGFSRDVSRREVAHIVLLFTDGLSKDPQETAREAELAKKDGIYLFSVGIGPSVEQLELSDIASDPDEEFVFLVNNFSVLNTIKNILAIKTCDVMPRDQVSMETEIECSVKGPIDLVFVYDSAQLGIPKTRQITKFVDDVTASLQLTSNHLKVGRLVENCFTGADVYLTSQKHAIGFDRVNFPDFRRMMLKLARNGFSESSDARKLSKKVAVLFIDDTMENLKLAAEELARLRETHTLVVSIGDTDLLTAAAFASRPTADFLVHVPSYKYLNTVKQTLLQKLCKTFGKDM